jgi:DNA-binding CsgD family transcriptional regulator
MEGVGLNVAAVGMEQILPRRDENGGVGAADSAREAFERRSWREAYELLAAADSLEVGDLERLAITAYLLGRDEASAEAWERAHLAALAAGDRDRSARCAFWLAFTLVLRGEMARAGGWRARAERLVEDAEPACASRGFLLVADFLEELGGGRLTTASDLADRIVDIARRCGDRDLLALGMLGRGQVSLALGEVRRGVRLLDEVMVSVTTGEVTPIPAGIVYCAVIEACVDVFDLRRATEWTEALRAWCSSEPDLIPYRGQCLVHRSQVLQAHGDWPAAIAEAELARARLSDPFHPALGVARYQQGELHRLRGEFAAAARAYHDAGELGRNPVPGVALLRLSEGDVAAACVAVERMLAGNDPRTRLAVLAAAVDVHLAAGDVEQARVADEELARFADLVDAPLLHAIADRASGIVLLAQGDAGGALIALRRASAGWRTLGMPYDAARARVDIARACRAVGDHEGAELELQAARATFEQLGAEPDLASLDSHRRTKQSPLTDRELEVLRLVAAGRSNREIAAELVISPHTVSRHVQNIFVKLGLSSRAAATAYAYEHRLL